MTATRQGLVRGERVGEWRGLQSGAPKRALREDALKDTLGEGKEAKEAAVFAFESVGCNQEKVIAVG